MSELPIDIKTEDVSLLELPSSAEDIHVKTQKASQNTDLDMWEILRISKALQFIQGEVEVILPNW